MSKKYITEEVGEEYKQWKKGDLILIESPTGSGKTYFIKNKLKNHAKINKKNILILSNRTNLKEQLQHDIGEDITITVLNYQKVEAFMLHNVSLSNYDYIVMDEAHYFFTDASFNSKTDLFLPRLLKDNSICKIFMTATPTLLKMYLSKEKYEINYNYELPVDYSYLDKIVAFDTYESIDSIIEDIPQDEQIILFSSAKHSLEIAEKYKGTFICSKDNKDGLYDKYIVIKGDADEDTIYTENYNELKRIIETGMFNNRLLCTTTALDNGINIKEYSKVKHIIINILDRDTFIQCLGRKRIGEGEKIKLYFYSWKNDNMRINGFQKKIGDSVDRAKLLFKEGTEVYVKTKFKNDRFVDGRIIDDIWVDGKLTKQVNKCVYLKYINDLNLYKTILDKRFKTTFKRVIALNLKVDEDTIIEMETKIKTLSLEDAFEREVGRRLYKEDQNELIEFVGLTDARGRLQKSISQLNAYLESNKLSYLIISKKVKENNKLITVWIIEKLIIES